MLAGRRGQVATEGPHVEVEVCGDLWRQGAKCYQNMAVSQRKEL